jgi:glycosylphosphatidylinositol deacylase
VPASSSAQRGAVLDRWLRDGRLPPLTVGFPGWLDLNQTNYTVLPPGPVVLRALRGAGDYVPCASPRNGFNDEVRGLCIRRLGFSVGPHHSSSLSVSFYLCSSTSDDAHSPSPACQELYPSSLKLIPNPSPEKPFPVPHEGVDESEGVVVFEAELPGRDGDEHRWVAVTYSTNDERGWILGGFVEDEPTVKQFNVHGTYSIIFYHPLIDESA